MPKDKDKDDLTREGEPKQETDQGLEIPVPKRKDFFGLLDKAARKRRREETSESDQGKRRTSRDDR